MEEVAKTSDTWELTSDEKIKLIQQRLASLPPPTSENSTLRQKALGEILGLLLTLD